MGVYICMYVCTYVNTTCICTYVLHTYIPYLSVLNLGSNTRRGSSIRQVLQQNERNKCLGPFKHQMPKLLKNLISLKMVTNIKEN